MVLPGAAAGCADLAPTAAFACSRHMWGFRPGREARLARAQFKNSFLGGADLSGGRSQRRRAHGRRVLRKLRPGVQARAGESQRGLPRGAHLDQACGALYDDSTVWPDGFDYRAAGARHVNEDQEPGSVPPPD